VEKLQVNMLMKLTPGDGKQSNWYGLDTITIYREFHVIGEAKFAYGGLVFGSR